MPIEPLEPRTLFSTSLHPTAHLVDQAIDESSGVVAARLHPGVFFTHNDSGHKAILYAITATGAEIGRYALSVKTTDWEDIAADDAGHLYAADTGDNKAKRATVSVYRLAEPAAGTVKHPAEHKARVDRTWRLRFPGGPADSEAFFVAGDFGYLITKRKDGGRAAMYRFPLSANNQVRTLEKVATLNVTRPVTAADLSADGRQLAVAAKGALYVYALPTPGVVTSIAALKPRTFALPDKQIEAVTFTRKGRGLLLTAESREIYQLAL